MIMNAKWFLVAGVLLFRLEKSLLFLNAQSVVTVDGCDIFADECPLQFNSVCDNASGVDRCTNGDCYDCDSCRQLDFDCSGCLAIDGCYWCAGDAICSSLANQLGGEIFGPGTSCPDPSDWSSTTACTTSGNHFR
jgi:hypothetical protein